MSELTQEEKITVGSYDRAADVWESNHSTPKFWGANFDKFHGLLPTGRILEIGCGAGRDAQELIKMGYDYFGTDISEGLLNLARKNNPGSNFLQLNAYDLDFTEPFDGFWCAAMLIHIPKARVNEALQSIKRSMKPQAIGFIAVKEGDGEKMESRPDLHDGEFLYSYWHDEEYRRVLDQNGLEVVHHGYMPTSPRSKWLTYLLKVS